MSNEVGYSHYPGVKGTESLAPAFTRAVVVRYSHYPGVKGTERVKVKKDGSFKRLIQSLPRRKGD